MTGRRGLLGRARLGVLATLGLLALVLSLSSDSQSVGLCGVFKTWLSGEVLTSSDLNNSMIQAAQTNDTPACTDDYSATATQMGVEADPYPSGAESLAASLAGELERLRYQLAKLVVGPNQGAAGYKWYLRPVEGPRPNLLVNGSVEKWGAGAAVAPDNWTLAGAGATVARNATGAQVKIGTYSADITRAGTDVNFTQTVTTPQVLPLHSVGYVQGRIYTLGAWVRATVAARCRIILDDGVATTSSTFHTGGSAFEYLTVTRTMSGSATALSVILQVATGNTTCQFDGVTLVEGYLAPTFTPHPADLVVSARVYNDANISIADNTVTALTFNQERWDTSDFHSTVSNTSRLTVPVAGKYQAGCTVQFASNATGSRLVQVRVNGTTLVGSTGVPAVAAVNRDLMLGGVVTALAGGDYLECTVYQTSGGALNVNTVAQYSPEFWVTWVSP